MNHFLAVTGLTPTLVVVLVSTAVVSLAFGIVMIFRTIFLKEDY